MDKANESKPEINDKKTEKGSFYGDNLANFEKAIEDDESKVVDADVRPMFMRENGPSNFQAIRKSEMHGSSRMISK